MLSMEALKIVSSSDTSVRKWCLRIDKEKITDFGDCSVSFYETHISVESQIDLKDVKKEKEHKASTTKGAKPNHPKQVYFCSISFLFVSFGHICVRIISPLH